MSTDSSRWIVSGAIAVAVLVCDQLVKLSVTENLLLGERRELVGVIAIERTENSGIAFGVAAGAPPVAIAAGAAVVAVALVWIASRVRWPYGPVGMGLVVGGAVGNLFDRIARGAVVDFVDVGPWPNFNLADMAITVGVALLVLGALKQDGQDRA